MSLATITSKGQVTIPKDIRQSLHLNAGDKIEMLATKNGEAIIRPISKTVDEVFGLLKRPGQKPVSVEEMNEAIGQHLRNHWR
ncbi:MAG: AbrB/MazE/SpoVT family DNA-binding domain-containing protein [Candidatus Thiodubiliella endoseptemdiera]|uniref:AbrB/MazE/SpoVT family DNA-binding domain-containing protein n=1 Tax=Candidatus Thiodubiliella endoseptemdiera TaxID=2738886 RepID=A0A853F2H0_9GAMM|nr:AbrB/MazE/SpoVT family DNA-binding domain-containing protein [Candidatus Thiodubiliella endoseptemdiera]